VERLCRPKDLLSGVPAAEEVLKANYVVRCLQSMEFVPELLVIMQQVLDHAVNRGRSDVQDYQAGLLLAGARTRQPKRVLAMLAKIGGV
jgi:hypothetical protein